MKVQAIREGYYNHRRIYSGEQFSLLKEGDFSEKWMKPLDSQVAPVEVSPVTNQQPAEVKSADETSSDDVI